MTALALIPKDAPRPTHYRLKGKRVDRAELAALMGVTLDVIADWVELGAPVSACDETGLAILFDCTDVVEWLLELLPAPSATISDPLPPSAQEIADVIGRERALFLIGQLPQCGTKSGRVCLYVPKRIGPDHPLVRMIGWRDANRLVQEFGGIILQPSNCRFVHREFRKLEARRLRAAGWGIPAIADAIEVSARQVFNLLAGEKTPEEQQP